MDQDGDLWMSHWRDVQADRVGGTRLEGIEPAQIAGQEDARPDWAAIGGRLIPGAVTVEVRDDGGVWCRAATENGARVAFITRSTAGRGLPPRGLPPVRFTDHAGRLVPRIPEIAPSPPIASPTHRRRC